MSIGFILSVAVSFVITAILARIFIPVLKSIKMGQKILDIGPRWHKSKEGTPTMGGLFFIAAGIIPCVFYAVYYSDAVFLIHYAFMLLNGLVGFLDDYVKFFKKQNKGLSARQKLVLQTAIAALYIFSLNACGNLSTYVKLPFISQSINLGILYYVILILGIVFTVNSTNLTDGIDGLCSSINAVVMIFMAVLCVKSANMDGLYLCGATLGGMLGFLVYNFHPAKVFMGDTGSLYIGGAVVATAMILDIPVILLFVGIMYYVESVSVMIQVTSYKLTKKRVFKMTPIHHHFEMCGWNEVKIVFVFSLVTALFSAIGCFVFVGIV